jgi:hypothetical protein
MSQDYELIGQLSPEAEALDTENPAGWIGEIPTDLGAQEITHQFTARRQRSNIQALGLEIPNMAGYADEPPAAALDVTPW